MHMSSAPFASDSSQILIPESFMALYQTAGRLQRAVNQVELIARYELCEDLAQMLCEPTAAHQFQLGITEELALERCLQGLLATPQIVREAEARWVICRLAELLNWPLPHWGLHPAP